MTPCILKIIFCGYIILWVFNTKMIEGFTPWSLRNQLKIILYKTYLIPNVMNELGIQPLFFCLTICQIFQLSNLNFLYKPFIKTWEYNCQINIKTGANWIGIIKKETPNLNLIAVWLNLKRRVPYRFYKKAINVGSFNSCVTV